MISASEGSHFLLTAIIAAILVMGCEDKATDIDDYADHPLTIFFDNRPSIGPVAWSEDALRRSSPVRYIVFSSQDVSQVEKFMNSLKCSKQSNGFIRDARNVWLVIDIDARTTESKYWSVSSNTLKRPDNTSCVLRVGEMDRIRNAFRLEAARH